MTVRGYLRILRKQWVVLLLCVVLGTGGAIAATLLAQPQYESEVTWYFSTGGDGESGAGAAYQGSLLSEQRVTSYQQLVAGRSITGTVVDELGLPIDPTDLAAAISTSTELDTVLLTASVTDPSPVTAQRIAAALGRALVARVSELEQPADPARPPLVTARVVEPAEVPTAPVSPRPVLNLALGLVVGIAFGLGAALLRSAVDTTVRTTEDLAAVIDAPNLGVTTHDAKAARRPLSVRDGPFGVQAEEFRQLRTNLLYVDLDRPRKAVVVTSPLPAEGKTTTVCNLAITFADAGRSVVVVEADLRRPRAADLFGLDRTVGLTSVLTGRIRLDLALQPWGDLDLDVLASGPIPPNPSELVGSQQMADVLAELRRRYDVVLLDVPPLLPVTDAAVLAAQADGALLVVRHGRTTRPQIEAATAALDKVSARLLGTLLASVPRKASAVYGSYESRYDPAEVGQHRSIRPAPAVPLGTEPDRPGHRLNGNDYGPSTGQGPRPGPVRPPGQPWPLLGTGPAEFGDDPPRPNPRPRHPSA